LQAGTALTATYEGLVEDVTRPAGRRPTAADLQDRLFTAEDELRSAEAAVARVAPTLLSGRRHPPDGSTSLAATQRALPEGTVLLTYTMCDAELIVWAVDADGERHERTAVPSRDLAHAARVLHSQCALRYPDAGAAAAVAGYLLEPVADALAGHDRVIVVPDGPLALVPFHVLPVGGRLLAEQVAVSTLPSAALVTRRRGGAAPRLDGGALLVGDPAYAADRRLSALPGTATEVQTIARLLGGGEAPLVGATASAAAVAQRAPDHAILHLAAHGILDERAPNRSYIALAGHDRLAVGDITGLDLNADLVVFSACHTGRGKATAGGDIVGLVRAAVTAGARHAVVSLWPVDDEAACLTMAAMYERLAVGTGVAAALRAAQLDVRSLDATARRHRYHQLAALAGTAPAAPAARDLHIQQQPGDGDAGLPYYWAPFIHIGL
jgi:CHAT domain-containing protein